MFYGTGASFIFTCVQGGRDEFHHYDWTGGNDDFMMCDENCGPAQSWLRRTQRAGGRAVFADRRVVALSPASVCLEVVCHDPVLFSVVAGSGRWRWALVVARLGCTLPTISNAAAAGELVLVSYGRVVFEYWTGIVGSVNRAPKLVAGGRVTVCVGTDKLALIGILVLCVVECVHAGCIFRRPCTTFGNRGPLASV